MSEWDPHRDLLRLLAALGHELVACGEPEVRAACFHNGDSIAIPARHVRVLIGMVVDDADASEAAMRPLAVADGREDRARQH